MSEQANVNLVQKMYAAFARGDIKTILDHLAGDIEWTLEGPAVIPFAGRRKGIPEVGKFFEALGGTQENAKLTTDEYIAQGDKVVTVGRYSATVKATGKRMDGSVVHVFTIRDGKVTRFLDCGDTAAMAEAYSFTSATAR